MAESDGARSAKARVVLAKALKSQGGPILSSACQFATPKVFFTPTNRRAIRFWHRRLPNY